jgi:hypothetical protein
MERFEAERAELSESVSWRRRGAGSGFLGFLHADENGLRLCGRDPESGLDIAFSIPSTQVESVQVTPTNGHLDGDLYVVLELDNGPPIHVRKLEGSSLHTQVLARRLRALLGPSPVAARQGG